MRFFIVILLIQLLQPIQGQSLGETYLTFTNESIHGLLISHRLFEGYNQEINKFVDLPDHQYNYFTNADLPKDIFEDPEQWFYKESPNTLFSKIKSSRSGNSFANESKAFTIAQQMNRICALINDLRFEIENHIKTSNLSNENELKEVYALLEQGVKYYDDFFERQRELELIIEPTLQQDLKLEQLVQQAKVLTRQLRDKNDENFQQDFETFRKIYNSINQSNSYSSRMKKPLGEFYTAALAYSQQQPVGEEYKLYGRFYFYHNLEFTTNMNRYGNGWVARINEKKPQFFEEPHFFQVVYPKKLEIEEIVSAKDDNIPILPKNIRERNIKTSDQKIIVDTVAFELMFYDYKLADGDSVSINFNGDWILENQSLEHKPFTVKIQMNKRGKNYIVVHAESVGRRPPNTVGIRYFKDEKPVEIVLQSDLNESELIEIDFLE